MFRRKSDTKKGFMYYVQLHERAWGFDRYASRPPLEDILEASVVVFWQVEGNEERHTVTLHNDLKEIEKLFYQMVLRSHVNIPKKRIVRIYHNQKRVLPKAVRILFEEVEEE